MSVPDLPAAPDVPAEEPSAEQVREWVMTCKRAANDFEWYAKQSSHPDVGMEHAQRASELAHALPLLIQRAHDAEARATTQQTRRFPIMNGPSIPWSAIAAFDKQAQDNHGGQDLEKLAKRGGLSVCEAIAIMKCERHKDLSAIPLREQIATMISLADDWQSHGNLALRDAEQRIAALTSERSALRGKIEEALADARWRAKEKTGEGKRSATLYRGAIAAFESVLAQLPAEDET